MGRKWLVGCLGVGRSRGLVEKGKRCWNKGGGGLGLGRREGCGSVDDKMVVDEMCEFWCV